LTADLETIQASVQEEDTEGFLLSFDLTSDDFFDAIDLSGLAITPLGKGKELASLLGKGKELADLAPELLKMMNQAVRGMSFPLQIHIQKPLPLCLNGLVLRLTYTKVPWDAQRDFLSLLFGTARDAGSFDLAPAIIGDSADTAFILSNSLIIETIKAGLGAVADDGELFELSNDYPARIGNAKKVLLEGVKHVGLRIGKGHIRIFFEEGKLHADVDVSYRTLATGGIWHAIHGKSTTAFASENGKIQFTCVGKLSIPWTVFLNVLPPFLVVLVKARLKAFISNLVNVEGELIAVPGFDVSRISTPAYVQVTGKVKTAG
jgi:hypothetical protein